MPTGDGVMRTMVDRHGFHSLGVDDPARWAAADRFQAWGIVDESKAVYVPRDADDLYLNVILSGRDCHVQGSRQSGKSSLVNHAVPRLLEKDFRVAWVDLAAARPAEPGVSDEWTSQVVRELFRSAGIADRGRALLDDDPRVSLREALHVLHAEDDSPLLVVFDEVDALEAHPTFARAVLGQLRAAQLARARGELTGLLLTLCSVKPPPEFFVDQPGQPGPKEVGGESVWLEDFHFDSATLDVLADGFGPDVEHGRELARHALEFSGGYPNACMWVCRTIVLRGHEYSADLPDTLLNEVERVKRRPPDFLTVTANYIDEHPQAATAALLVYLQVLNRQDVAHDGLLPAHQLLVWSGLCRVAATGALRPRARLLETYFDRQWARSKLERTQAKRAARRTAKWTARRRDKRICILNTGGTIGMVEHPDGQVKTPEDPTELPFDDVDQVADFVAVNLFSRDSANVGPRDWAAIAAAIKQREGKFDGFVVAHGTDTLAYSASAVAFALGARLTFPVVFTGSQTTVDVSHGDARSNLLRSALVAVEDLPEVVVCFGEYVLRACRAQKKDDRRFDAFESPAYAPLGYVAEEVYLNRDNFRKNAQRGPIDLKAAFADGILQIAQTPGADAFFYLDALEREDERNRRLCRGIVIQSLGAGNIPTHESGRGDLVPVIERARDLNIPVVLTSQYPVHPRNLTRYSPAMAAIEAGAIPTGNMTVASVIAKLSWILADVDTQIESGALDEDRRRDEVGRRMQRDEIGEVSDILVDED